MIELIFGRRYNIIDQVIAMGSIVLIYTTHLPVWAIVLGAAVATIININYEVYYDEVEEDEEEL